MNFSHKRNDQFQRGCVFAFVLCTALLLQGCGGPQPKVVSPAPTVVYKGPVKPKTTQENLDNTKDKKAEDQPTAPPRNTCPKDDRTCRNPETYPGSTSPPRPPRWP